MTYQQTREALVTALMTNAYLNMCESSDIKNAIDAIDKQIPKKPILKYHKEDVTPVKYGRLIEFLCPNCGKFIVALYETDIERGGVIVPTFNTGETVYVVLSGNIIQATVKKITKTNTGLYYKVETEFGLMLRATAACLCLTREEAEEKIKKEKE